MNTTLAAIKLAYLVSFGLHMAPTDSYVHCGEDVLLNEGRREGVKLLQQSQQVLDANPSERDYDKLAEQVRALRK